jgi:hypothetical protein
MVWTMSMSSVDSDAIVCTEYTPVVTGQDFIGDYVPFDATCIV